jgi:hypothetical protein
VTAVRSIHGISLVFVPVLILSLFRPAHARELCRDPSALDRAKTVTLHVIDVGQGDAMALVCQDGSIGMVIDGGDYRDRGGLARFRKKVKALADASPAGRSVKLVMATHQRA